MITGAARWRRRTARWTSSPRCHLSVARAATRRLLALLRTADWHIPPEGASQNARPFVMALSHAASASQLWCTTDSCAALMPTSSPKNPWASAPRTLSRGLSRPCQHSAETGHMAADAGRMRAGCGQCSRADRQGRRGRRVRPSPSSSSPWPDGFACSRPCGLVFASATSGGLPKALRCPSTRAPWRAMASTASACSTHADAQRTRVVPG